MGRPDGVVALAAGNLVEAYREQLGRRPVGRVQLQGSAVSRAGAGDVERKAVQGKGIRSIRQDSALSGDAIGAIEDEGLRRGRGVFANHSVRPVMGALGNIKNKVLTQCRAKDDAIALLGSNPLLRTGIAPILLLNVGSRL